MIAVDLTQLRTVPLVVGGCGSAQKSRRDPRRRAGRLREVAGDRRRHRHEVLALAHAVQGGTEAQAASATAEGRRPFRGAV